MNKVTKKQQIEELQTVVAAQWRQINKLKLHLGRLVDIDWTDEQADHDAVIAILDRKEPQLKQLDQSVFDSLDAKWRFAAVDRCGEVWACTAKTKASDGVHLPTNNQDTLLIGDCYDTTDWQNSLIERKELTGSDLARAMLARGDKYVSGFGHHHSDAAALDNKFADTVSKHTQCFQSSQNAWDYFVPINNQGEPLTASEVGLRNTD